MKKIVSIMLVLVAVLTLSFNAMAAKVDFVESIENKGAPEIVADVDKDGNKVIVDSEGNTVCKVTDKDTITVTPVSDSSDKDLADAYAQIKDKGTDVFEDLDKDNMVVRDLVNITTDSDTIKNFVAGEGKSIPVTLKMDVTKDTEVVAYVLVAGVWKKAPVVNNNDGTVTVTLSEFGPVAFLVEGAAAGGTSPDTGDAMGNSMVFWTSIMAASLVLIAVLVVVLRRQNKAVR